MFQRALDLKKLLQMRSFFLFGPRGTGKSTLIAQSLTDAKVYDLLDAETFQRLLRAPKVLEQENAAHELIVIDEVQKLPALLDEVHRLIAKRNQRFLLTGSSARKLRRGAANLLAGRAFEASLFPLSYCEIPDFDLMRYLNTTGLPEFYAQDLAADFLNAYIGTYLREEIQAEALTRNLVAFSRFLEVVGLSNGQEINYAAISSDSGIPARTVENYYSVLVDTLIGFQVPPFLSSKKRKAITRSKFYLFDVGVVNRLARRGVIEPKSELFGHAFEHFIALELRAWLSYRRKTTPLTYWRTTSQFEVDFILGDEIAIETKATDLVTDRHLKGLRALKEEGLVKKHVIVSMDPEPRAMDDGIVVMPWRAFLAELWGSQ